jgi:hypothetical protein
MDEHSFIYGTVGQRNDPVPTATILTHDAVDKANVYVTLSIHNTTILTRSHRSKNLVKAIHFFSLFLSIIPIFFIGSILYACLENRAISTDTIHDAADTVHTYTLSHMLYKCSRIAMMSNKATECILYLNGHVLTHLQ